MRFLPIYLLCYFFFLAPFLQAAEMRELYRGARATGLSGAFVSIADDEQAIFMNPAGLAAQKKFKINYATVLAEASDDLVMSALQGSTTGLGDFDGNTINDQLMGKNIYIRAQATPSLIMPNIGISILIDDQVAILAKNRVCPQITLGYQMTNGLQAAGGFSLMPRTKIQHDFRVGLGAKILWRRGGYKKLSLVQVLDVNQGMLETIAGSYELGYGVDTGLQYIRNFGKSFSAAFGLAYTDIGNTSFVSNSDPIYANLTAGISLSYQIKSIKVTLAYDQRHLFESVDAQKRNHLGLELSLPMITVYGGINQVYYSYGLSFDAWLFRLTAMSYAEEMSAIAYQDETRRYMLDASLKIGF